VATDVPRRQRILFSEEVLPSDWRFREDLIWLYYREELIAHQWKLRLEVEERKDRAGRQNAVKKREKRK
jgi:hypothetical protein